MALVKKTRSSHSPSPIYGDGSYSLNKNFPNQGLLRPGFTVGDLDTAYSVGTPTGGPVSVYASTSAGDATGTTKSPKARVIKIIINVTAGAGTVDITMKSASDTFTATIFDSTALSLGSYEFYVGGWSSPTDGDAGYQATQYGPVKAGSSPNANDPTGDMETGANKDINADSNYVGGTYNPVNFISLDGADVKFFSTISGSVTYDVEFLPVS